MYGEWDNYVGSMYYKFIEYKSELRDILRVNLKYIAAGRKQTDRFVFCEIWIARSVVSPIMRPPFLIDIEEIGWFLIRDKFCSCEIYEVIPSVRPIAHLVLKIRRCNLDFIVTISLPEFMRWQTYTVDLNLKLIICPLTLARLEPGFNMKNVEKCGVITIGWMRDTDQIMSVDHVPIVYT